MADKEVSLTLKVDAKQLDTATKGATKLEKAHKSYVDTLSDEGKEIRSVNKSKQQLKKQQDLEAQAADSAAGSYDQLSAQYRLNVIQLNQLNTTVGEASDETLDLVNETADLKTKMNEAKKATNDFRLQVGDYRDEAKEATTQTNNFGGIGRKAFGLVGKAGKGALRGIGLAFKAMGIGLVVAGFAALWEALKKNQKVMDAFKTVTNAIGLVLRPVIDGIGDLIEGIAKGSEEFDAIGKVMKNLIKLALIPLRISFNRLKLGIQYLTLGWYEVKKAFGGDVDDGKIEQLRKGIDETREANEKLLESAKNSARAVVANASEAFDEVTALGKKVADGISKAVDDVKNGAAKAATDAANALELLDAEQEKLKLQFQKRAEVFRQIRDDESKQIAERIKANEDLGKVLLEQANSERNAVNQKIAAQQQLNNVNGKTIEGDKALAELRNQLLEIDERVNSQQSEQLVNLNSLNKEKIEKEREFLVAKQELINDMALEAAETEQERELLKAEQDFEKKELELEQMILDAEERTELEALLLEQKETTLQDIRDKWNDKKLEEQAKTDDKEVKAKLKMSKLQQSITKGLYSVLSGLLGDSLASQIAGIGVEAAIQSASAGIKSSAAQASNLAQATAAAPPPFNAALIAIAGTQNVAMAANTAKSIGGIWSAAALSAGVSALKSVKFANGGFLNGSPHSQGGIDLGFGREAEGGEFITSKATMSNPQLSGLIQAANNAGNSGSNIDMVSRTEVLEIAREVVNATPVYVLEQDITETQRTVSVRESEFNG